MNRPYNRRRFLTVGSVPMLFGTPTKQRTPEPAYTPEQKLGQLQARISELEHENRLLLKLACERSDLKMRILQLERENQLLLIIAAPRDYEC